MEAQTATMPPLSRLSYKKDDLIIKEGDYGISIYEIQKGKVGVFIRSGKTEFYIAALGPGEIFGEMTFLTGSATIRSASVRALEDSDVVALHPDRLKNEFEEMTPIIKHITGQTIERLVRMNKKHSKLIERNKEKQELANKLHQVDPNISRRRSYRKFINKDCLYSPANARKKYELWGRMHDISEGGARLDINQDNLKRIPHKAGDEFVISTFLSKGKNLDAHAKIVSINKDLIPQKVSLGLSFVNLSEGARRNLGFYLMA